MKKIFFIALFITAFTGLSAQPQPRQPQVFTPEEKEIVELSKTKWQWMADKNVDALETLFAPGAVFVHMGGAMPRDMELQIIRSGGIHYKHAEIFENETTVNILDRTAILLNRIRLTAIVGGNEVVNPFICTEVYAKIDGKWKLGSLSFTRLMGD